LGSSYFLIRVWAAPAALSTYTIIGWFYGLQDARVPLVLQIGINVINIVLDLLFVFGFGWGVEGVAAASVVAEYSGLALAIYFVRRRLRALRPAETPVRIFDLVKMRRILTFNGFIFFRTLCVVTGMAVFMAQSAKLGDIPLAANQVLYNFLLFTSFGLDGLAHAAEALIGQAIGRRDRGAFDQAARSVLMWSGVVGVINILVYWIFGAAIIALLTNIAEVRIAAETYLPWAIAMPAVSVWAYTLDGVFLGATRAGVMLVSMLISFAAYMTAMFTFLPLYDNHALWLALNAFLGFRGLTLLALYPRLRRDVETRRM
jgi:MATE family multidrug resistance protein